MPATKERTYNDSEISERLKELRKANRLDVRVAEILEA